MPSPDTTRVQRLRKTKAQLIDVIEMLEQPATPIAAKAGDRDLADLARFPSENPNPVLRGLPDGTVLYANDAAHAVKGLLEGRKKSTLARELAGACAEASRTAEAQGAEFDSGDRVFAFSIAPVTGETYINIYGRDISREHAVRRKLAAKEAQLRVALDGMPGLLVYTDEDLNIVLCNERFREKYQAQREMLQPGQPYPVFLRCLAEQGYYGEGEADALVAERIESLRNPSDKTFQETTPDGRVHRVRRQRVAAGGTVTVVTDITEQKRAEKELAKKEAQLRLALEHMPGGMMLTDPDMNSVLFNAQYSELCDFPDGLVKVGGSYRDEMGFQADRGDFGPGDKDDLIEEVAAIYRRGEAVSFERTIAGSGRTVQIYVAPTPEGGYVSIITDITERTRAELELAEKEAQLRLAMDNMLGGIAICDKDLNNVLFNARYSELFDYPDGLLKVGGSVRDELRFQVERGDFGPGDTDDLIEAWYATYRTDEADSYEREIAGSGRTLQIFGAPTPEGGWIIFATDITERKQAEQELAEKEAQLRVALDNMPGGMELVDRDWNYVFFNSQYSELHGYPDGLLKVGGSVLDETRFQAERGDYGPGDPNKLMEEAHVPFRSGEPESYERTLPGGRTLHFNVAPTPDGGYVTIATDITERKRAEDELARKEAQLRVALDHMPGGMKLIDGDRKYVLFNPRYSELHDYPDGLLKEGGSIIDEARFQAERGDYGPGDPDQLIEESLVPYESGESESYERTIPGGRTLQFYSAPTPEGGFVSIVTDITERKQAEEALLAAKQRSEKASELVAEKNLMLESLSNQLSKYLSPQVYASIFSGAQSVEIASKRKKLTVFFSDIVDFTGTTDSLESEELTNLLNHYLTEMSKIALEHGATIDKYVGDSIIAFFGDPESRGVKEDARACVNMAIAMQRRMRELRSDWLDMGLERPFELRIGINTGFCTVGNFGSAERMDYTIIGNQVNLAARLESLAEVGGILMAHETHALVKDTVMAEEGGTLTLKGFAKPVRTYSVVGLYDELAEQGRIIRRDEEGLRILVDLDKRDRADAIQAIESVLSQLKD